MFNSSTKLVSEEAAVITTLNIATQSSTCVLTGETEKLHALKNNGLSCALETISWSPNIYRQPTKYADR